MVGPRLSILISVLAACVTVLASTVSAASPISGVVVTTDAGTDDGVFGGPIQNIVNGSGLTGTFPSETHGNDTQTMWYSGTHDAAATLTFDLGSTYSLDQLAVYRYNSTLDPFAVVFRFDVDVSFDGIAYSRAFTYCCGSTVGVGKPDLDADVVAFTPETAARYVRFGDIETWGSPRIGFSEVVFSGSIVPEPSTYTLMLAGLGALGFAARRRKCIARHVVNPGGIVKPARW